MATGACLELVGTRYSSHAKQRPWAELKRGWLFLSVLNKSTYVLLRKTSQCPQIC